MKAQLKLVTEVFARPVTSMDPTRRVFDHWVLMMGKNPARCKMGTTRRGAINAALALYDEDQVLMALEGAASDPWVAGDNPMGRPHDDVEWILRCESSIERYSEIGERLRERVLQMDAARDVPVVAEAAIDPVRVAEAREKLRQLAARMSGRA